MNQPNDFNQEDFENTCSQINELISKIDKAALLPEIKCDPDNVAELDQCRQLLKMTLQNLKDLWEKSHPPEKS